MNEHDFRDLVIQDAIGRAERDQAQWLRNDENVNRWYDGLVSTKQELQAQLSEKKADFSALSNECWNKGNAGRDEFFARKAEYETWKATVVRMIAGIERRLIEVRGLRKKLNDTNRIDFKAELRDAVMWAKDIITGDAPQEDENAWLKRYNWMVGQGIIKPGDDQDGI